MVVWTKKCCGWGYFAWMLGEELMRISSINLDSSSSSRMEGEGEGEYRGAK